MTRSILLLTGIAVNLIVIRSASAQVAVPHEFEAGTPARASEVNANFEALVDAVNANGESIAGIETGTQGPAGPPGPRGPAGGSQALVAIVATEGGDYENPLDAVRNMQSGEAWCPEEAREPQLGGCLIRIAPGVYELDQTLVVPARVSVVGSGPASTILSAGEGVAVAVEVGTAVWNESGNLRATLRDLTVENRYGDGSSSTAISTERVIDSYDMSNVELVNVRAHASGSVENVGISTDEEAVDSFRHIEVTAEGGMRSIGVRVGDPAYLELESSVIRARDATGSNIGLSHDGGHEGGGGVRISNSYITARGGSSATGVSAHQQTAAMTISDSTIRGHLATTSNVGLRTGALDYSISLFSVEVEARSPSNGFADSTAIYVDLRTPAETAYRFRNVYAHAEGPSLNTGMKINSFAANDETIVVILDSEIRSTSRDGGTNYGMWFLDQQYGDEDVVARIDRSTIGGSAASIVTTDSVNGGRVLIGGTHLDGPLQGDGLQYVCAGVYDQDYEFSANVCPSE